MIQLTIPGRRSNYHNSLMSKNYYVTVNFEYKFKIGGEPITETMFMKFLVSDVLVYSKKFDSVHKYYLCRVDSGRYTEDGDIVILATDNKRIHVKGISLDDSGAFKETESNYTIDGSSIIGIQLDKTEEIKGFRIEKDGIYTFEDLLERVTTLKNTGS